MARFDVRVEGDARLRRKLRELGEDAEREMLGGLERAGQAVRGRVLRDARGTRSGREYKVPGTGRTYTASAPGQPPASRTGTLYRSISVEVRRAELVALVGSNLEYAVHLEFGTRHMAPRPFLTPAYEASQDAITEALTRAFRRAVAQNTRGRR